MPIPKICWLHGTCKLNQHLPLLYSALSLCIFAAFYLNKMQPLPNILPSVETVCQHTIQKYKSMKYNWYKISMKYFDIKFLFKFYDWQLLLIIILDLLLPDRYSCCLLLYLGMLRPHSTSIQAVAFRNWRSQTQLHCV